MSHYTNRIHYFMHISSDNFNGCGLCLGGSARFKGQSECGFKVRKPHHVACSCYVQV